MKKIVTLFLALFALALPELARATCTFTQNGMYSGTATCSTGTESPNGASSGWNFSPGACPNGITVQVCAQTGNLTSGTGSMKFYFYNATRGQWAEAPTLAENISVGAPCQALAGVWTVANGSRFAVLPNAVGTAVYVDMVCR